MPRPVLLCFDGSEPATAAITAAGSLFEGREALVLSVATAAKDELPFDPVSDLVGRLSGLYSDWDDAVGTLAEHHARHGCALAENAGLHPRPLTAVGRTAATILRVADQHDAAVIVLGASGHHAPGRGIGGVAARVLHEARRPVLILPGPERG
jgi:nucleotide-binding universal stress UspA family protein